MNARLAHVTAVTIVCLVLVVGGTWAAVDTVRDLEARAVIAVLYAVGFTRVFLTDPATILVVPETQAPFAAVITPACSALIAQLSLAAMALVILRGRPVRRLVGCVAMAALIAVANVVRITAALLVGAAWGDSALVLFHDGVGTAFSLAYVITGFVGFLWMGLDRRAGRSHP